MAFHVKMYDYDSLIVRCLEKELRKIAQAKLIAVKVQGICDVSYWHQMFFAYSQNEFGSTENRSSSLEL